MDERYIEAQGLVERYVTGRLPPQEAARFEEYFLEHPECAAEVRAAQRLRRGLEGLAAREAVQRSVAAGLWSRIWRRRLALAGLLALIVALPLALQTRRATRLQESLEAALQPRVNTPIFELSSFRGVDLGGAAPQHIRLAPEGEWIVLALALPSAEDPPFRLELLDSQDQLVWEAAGLEADPLGRLVITLPSSLLPTGDYRILIERAAAAQPATVGRFAVRVSVGP